MSVYPSLVTVGTIGGGATAIRADVTVLGSDVPVFVTLSEDYEMLVPPGYPSRPSFTGADQATNQPIRTVPSGTRLAVLACEATALMAAGAAALS